VYIDQITLENARCFATGKPLELVHPDRAFRSAANGTAVADKLLPKPRLPNVTLLIGDNGSGKTTVLRALAAAAFGPAAKDLLRDSSIVRLGESTARIFANLRLHAQDHAAGETIETYIELERKGERLDLRTDSFVHEQLWGPVYESKNDAFFVVGYGATRRVERLDTYDPGARSRSRAARDLRVLSLFEESFSLIPLAGWLPGLKRSSPGRYAQVDHLLNMLLAPSQYRFTGEQDKRGEYLFSRGGISIPFQSLSDGYRGFIGWVADLLHHVSYASASGKKLIENRGVTLVDEIDLLLHPKWQMHVIRTVAKALPNMQFIFTSHSPLVAGSLEWMNIITLKAGAKSNGTVAQRLKQSIHGLDADQILISRFFGLRTSRAASKREQLSRLRQAATLGNDEAKRSYIRALASGMEETDAVTSTEPGRDEE
jgi:predicted ATPase